MKYLLTAAMVLISFCGIAQRPYRLYQRRDVVQHRSPMPDVFDTLWLDDFTVRLSTAPLTMRDTTYTEQVEATPFFGRAVSPKKKVIRKRKTN